MLFTNANFVLVCKTDIYNNKINRNMAEDPYYMMCTEEGVYYKKY